MVETVQAQTDQRRVSRRRTCGERKAGPSLAKKRVPKESQRLANRRTPRGFPRASLGEAPGGPQRGPTRKPPGVTQGSPTRSPGGISQAMPQAIQAIGGGPLGICRGPTVTLRVPRVLRKAVVDPRDAKDKYVFAAPCICTIHVYLHQGPGTRPCQRLPDPIRPYQPPQT